MNMVGDPKPPRATSSSVFVRKRVNHAFKAIARRLNEAEFRPECMFAQKLRIDRNKLASCKRRAQVFQLGCLCNQIHGHFIKNLAAFVAT